MFNFYVYIYLNPLKSGSYSFGKLKFDYEPFYVGKGKNYRYLVHGSVIDNHNKLKQNTLNKIKRHGLKPIIIKQYFNVSEASAFRLEKQLISLIGRRDLQKGTLCNLTDGGEGSAGAIYDYNKRCKLISNKEKIVKYSLNGAVIEIFENIVDLALKYPKLNPRTNHIHRACRNQSRIFDNYYWKYFNGENIGDVVDVPDNKKKILQYDLNGKFIQIYNSSVKLRDLGYSSGAILKCCRNNQKGDKLYKFKNFMWLFYQQNNKIMSHITPYYTNNAAGSDKIIKDKIQMISLKGEILGEYLPKELKTMGFQTKTIYGCCNGKFKKSQGYAWKWVTEL